jgi:hypothetical protein
MELSEEADPGAAVAIDGNYRLKVYLASLAGGTSPVLNHATVGSDISSATQGSSAASVAGKSRAPTKQWAEAQENDSNVIKRPNANAYAYLDKRNITNLRFSELESHGVQSPRAITR